jgi:hypothetical protein
VSFFCDFESLREEDFGAPVKKSSVSPPPAFIPRLVLLVTLGVIFVFLSFSYRLRLIPRVLDSQQESREPPEKASKQRTTAATRKRTRIRQQDDCCKEAAVSL